MTPTAGSFDQQARHYDTRTGLPAAVGAAVARAIVDQSGAGADDLVVELGAGTGEIGMHLARLPVRYLALDSAPAMLEVFRHKAGLDARSLIVADCDTTWPLRDGCATVVFASRVVHLLRPDHVARETLRVCQPAGLLVLGRVVRDPDGVAQRLNRQRRMLLAQAGITARDGEAGTRRVIEGCLARGSVSLGRRSIAAWTSEITPGEILASWDTLSRMGSVSVTPELQGEILAELRRWACAEFGPLDRPEVSTMRYVIDVIRVP